LLIETVHFRANNFSKTHVQLTVRGMNKNKTTSPTTATQRHLQLQHHVIAQNMKITKHKTFNENAQKIC
jgi:hypothetical protein